ncbi:MAG: hypothetical protein WD960_10760 [Gemmatimonadota bacterium]
MSSARPFLAGSDLWSVRSLTDRTDVFGAVPTLDLTMAPEQLSMRWLDILVGEWGDATTLEGGGIVDLAPPDAGPWAVLIQNMETSR